MKMLIIFTKASIFFQEFQVIFPFLGKSLRLDCEWYRPCYIDFVPSLKRVPVIFILTIYIRSVINTILSYDIPSASEYNALL